MVEFDPSVVEEAPTSVDARDEAATRAFGDAWHAERRSVALRVPSVVAPASSNYLLNPDHQEFDAAVKRRAIGPFRFDERLRELVRRAKLG